jgi:hypothetical protein
LEHDVTQQAFHNDPEFKSQLVAAAIEHRKSDDYIAGAYAEGNGRFRGCSVGCSLHDVQKLRGVKVVDHGDHELLAQTLGVPEWLCRLQDSIFEGLPDDKRSRWTERLYAAIPIGADLEPVKHKLAIRCLTRLADAQRKALETATDDHGLADAIKQVLAALDQVIACHRAEVGEVECVADWSAARSAASAAESAAWSAAESAWSAARSAALSAAWEQEADDLIELLEAA